MTDESEVTILQADEVAREIAAQGRHSTPTGVPTMSLKKLRRELAGPSGRETLAGARRGNESLGRVAAR